MIRHFESYQEQNSDDEPVIALTLKSFGGQRPDQMESKVDFTVDSDFFSFHEAFHPDTES
jgi:hypothetical protein